MVSHNIRILFVNVFICVNKLTYLFIESTFNTVQQNIESVYSAEFQNYRLFNSSNIQIFFSSHVILRSMCTILREIRDEAPGVERIFPSSGELIIRNVVSRQT